MASMILANKLDIESFAAYSNFQLTVSMLSSYAAMGLGVTASKLYAEINHGQNRGHLIQPLWIFSIAGSVFLSLGSLAFPPEWFSGNLNTPRWILALGIFSISIGIIPSGAILGLERYKESTWIAILSAILLIFGCLQVQGSGATVAMLLFTTTALITSIGNGFLVKYFSPKNKSPSTPPPALGYSMLEVATFVGPMLLVGLIAASGSWIVGRVLLSLPDGTTSFSIYSIGLQWYSLALFLPGMISRVLLPRFIRAKYDSDSSKNKKFVKDSVLLTLAASLFIAAAGAVLSPWLRQLYGLTLPLKSEHLICFLIAAIPAAPANTLGNAIVANNGHLVWLLLSAVWLSFLILLCVPLSSQGALGGAYSLAIASTILTTLAYFAAKRKDLI